MIVDELWPKGPRFIRGGGFPLGTDAVLLAAFAGNVRARRACDLGCGTGIIALLLAWNSPFLTVDGVEIQPEAAETARKNAEMNGLSDRMNIITGDLRDHRSLLPAGGYGLVASNPPYFPSGSGKEAADAGIAAARDERSCTLDNVCEAAAYLTKWGGRFVMVHRPERLSEALCAMTARGLEPKRLRMVQYSAASAPNLVLIEARRGGKPGLTILPPLVMTDADGKDSEEIIRIYHREEAASCRENSIS